MHNVCLGAIFVHVFPEMCIFRVFAIYMSELIWMCWVFVIHMCEILPFRSAKYLLCTDAVSLLDISEGNLKFIDALYLSYIYIYVYIYIYIYIYINAVYFHLRVFVQVYVHRFYSIYICGVFVMYHITPRRNIINKYIKGDLHCTFAKSVADRKLHLTFSNIS